MTDMTRPKPPTSPHNLAFPSPKVHDSLSNLDLETLVMRSSAKKLSEGPPSSLEDSSYEVIGDHHYDTLSEDGRTESIASNDGQMADDVSSIADTDDFESDDMDDASQHLPMSDVPPPNHLSDSRLRPDGGDESMMTSKAETYMAESSHLDIEEFETSDDDVLEGVGIVRVFEEPEVPVILRDYHRRVIRISVRLNLAGHHLKISRPFRLLYVGEIPAWAKHDINNHIAAALAAKPDEASLASSSDSQSSRFSVVRLPSFPEGGAATKVQLVSSSGIELVVDQCSSVHTIPADGGNHNTVEAVLSDGTLLSFGPNASLRRIGNGSNTPYLPDLAIFCHNTVLPTLDSEMQMANYDLVREAFKMHDVSILDIATVRPYHNCPKYFSYTPETLRSCVEGRSDETSEFNILETLPVDIYSFLELAPAQLNRHLALITRRHSFTPDDIEEDTPTKKAQSMESTKWKWSKPSGFLSFFTNAMQKDRENGEKGGVSVFTIPRLHFWASLIALVSMVTVLLMSTSVTPLYPFLSPLTSLSSTGVASASSTPSVSSISVPVTTSPIPVVSPPPARSIKSSTSDVATSSGRFEVVPVDEVRFNVTLPTALSKMRRVPQLQVQVSRDSTPLSVQVAMSADGVYTIVLEQEYPYGLFDVEIRTKSKPLISQTSQVALGSRSHGLFSLKENMGWLSQCVKNDIVVAQRNLKNITTQISKTLQAGLVKFEDTKAGAFGQTKQWKQQVKDSTQSVAEHLQEAKEGAARQLSVGSHMAKDVSKSVRRTWGACAARASVAVQAVHGVRLPNVWRQTAPLRQSTGLLSARQNALKIWEKVGKGQRAKGVCGGQAGKTAKGCKIPNQALRGGSR